MVPTWFVKLDALPVGPNGKIDRRSLPAPAVNRAARAERFVAPRTSLERSIAQIWREVLKLETVGVHDNFFELGGHSLLAVQIMTKVRALRSIELPLRILFEAPTIAELANRVVSPAPDPFDCLVAFQPSVRRLLSSASMEWLEKSISMPNWPDSSIPIGRSLDYERHDRPMEERWSPSRPSPRGTSATCVVSHQQVPTCWADIRGGRQWRTKWRSSSPPAANGFSWSPRSTPGRRIFDVREPGCWPGSER